MPRLSTKRWVAAGTIIALIDFSLATAIPIRRVVQQGSSDHEKFVEAVVAQVPAAAALYAAPEFPYTTRVVLAYRLKRDIPAQELECKGEYYYLTIENSSDSCAKNMMHLVTNTRKETLHLLHVSKLS